MCGRYIVSISNPLLEFRVLIRSDLSLPYHPIVLMFCPLLLVYKRAALYANFSYKKFSLTLGHGTIPSIEVLVEVSQGPISLRIISDILPNVATRSKVVSLETVHMRLVLIVNDSLWAGRLGEGLLGCSMLLLLAKKSFFHKTLISLTLDLQHNNQYTSILLTLLIPCLIWVSKCLHWVSTKIMIGEYINGRSDWKCSWEVFFRHTFFYSGRILPYYNLYKWTLIFKI